MVSSSLIRTFIAVKIDDKEIIDKITRLQSDLTNAGLKAKLVEPHNLHITLKFIGEIPPLKVEAIKSRLSRLSFQEFDLELHGVGGFPTLNRARVLWIGVSKGAEELIEISEVIEKNLQQVSIPRSSKPFHPHLTIARVKRPLNHRVRKILSTYSNTDFGKMRVSKFYLMKSTLTSRGPIYTVISEYSF